MLSETASDAATKTNKSGQANVSTSITNPYKNRSYQVQWSSPAPYGAVSTTSQKMEALESKEVRDPPKTLQIFPTSSPVTSDNPSQRNPHNTPSICLKYIPNAINMVPKSSQRRSQKHSKVTRFRSLDPLYTLNRPGYPNLTLNGIQNAPQMAQTGPYGEPMAPKGHPNQ